MDAQKDKSQKDMQAISVVVGIGLLLLLMTTSVISDSLKMACYGCIISAFVAGRIGRERKIGYSSAFFLTLFLSPIVGFILTLNSPKINEEEYKERMLEIAEQNNATPSSVPDQLHKLNELRKEGVLTDEEFNQQKEKLLNT